jgi:hypothetical protein
MFIRRQNRNIRSESSIRNTPWILIVAESACEIRAGFGPQPWTLSKFCDRPPEEQLNVGIQMQ